MWRPRLAPFTLTGSPTAWLPCNLSRTLRSVRRASADGQGAGRRRAAACARLRLESRQATQPTPSCHLAAVVRAALRRHCFRSYECGPRSVLDHTKSAVRPSAVALVSTWKRSIVGAVRSMIKPSAARRAGFGRRLATRHRRTAAGWRAGTRHRSRAQTVGWQLSRRHRAYARASCCQLAPSSLLLRKKRTVCTGLRAEVGAAARIGITARSVDSGGQFTYGRRRSGPLGSGGFCQQCGRAGPPCRAGCSG